MVKLVALLLDAHVEHAHALLVPRERPVLRPWRQVDLLARAAGRRDGEHPVAVRIPRDRRLLPVVLEDRSLSAQEVDEHVAGHRHRGEARDVAGGRGPDVEALVAQVGERELLVRRT